MSAGLLDQEPWLRLGDNGLLIAQATRRLRRDAWSSFFMLGALCVFGTLVCVLREGTPCEGFRTLLFLVMGALLYLRATSVLVVGVSRERESGLLDFHRATPASPPSQALGYVLGCSAREWVSCAILLPFFLGASAFSGHLATDVVCLAVLVLGAVLYQTFAVWLGLLGGGAAKNTGALMMVVVGVLVAGYIARLGGFATLGHLTPFPVVAALWTDRPDPVDFFGLAVPPLAFTVLVQGHALTFLGWAVTRKLRRDGASSFSRPGALLFLATVAGLILGGTWETLLTPGGKPGNESGGVATLVALYLGGTTVLSAGLLWIVTPDHLGFLRALRRARSLGSKAPGILDDGGATLPLVAAMGCLLVAGLGVQMAGQAAVPMDIMASRPTLVAVLSMLSLLAFSSGVGEYSRLALRGSYKSGASLILFVVVVLPWLASAIMALAHLEDGLWLYVASLSPLAVLLSVVDMARHWSHAADEAMLVPTLVSLCSSTAVACWLHLQVASLRRAAAAHIPLGGNASRP